MHTDLQEQFEAYVREDIKAHLDEWCELRDASTGELLYKAKDVERRLLDKIIELRMKFAKENGLKTVTPVCPKLKDILSSVRRFIGQHVSSEGSKIAEKFKTLAISKVLNDELLLDKLNKILKTNFPAYRDGSMHGYSDLMFSSYSELARYIQRYYQETKHTFGKYADLLSLNEYVLARDIIVTYLTPQFVVNPDKADSFYADQL
ncbi:hypothetical protein Q7L89_05470 (plasmid) [Candidatus Liberibacter asiaticus]|uniref:hypothetical protein n=1 Tax=Liberibacter asiaticus TaxID=34021 RepID=UPI000EAA6969|nr:hypothetical protein [Candidatus Liberibacter asiaticus]RKL52304.1 hypothetical protein D2A38_05510 [Candidatus Liberibacter asiaticus]